MNRPNRVTVEQKKEDPIERKVLARSILDISASMHKLLGSGLNERAIVALVADYSGVGRPDIRAVLNSLRQLSKEYCS